MDKSLGMVTRSRRRLSDVSETKNDDNQSTCSTPTKKRGRRLSSNLNPEEFFEADNDMILNSDKTESSDVELRKKDLPLHVINNIMDSPSRNLRKRNISPVETKPNENSTPKKAVRKIDNLLIQNIVDSPKLRKNKRLSGGSDVDSSQELPAVRRSRRLSGELNVVLEDPIKEEQSQEPYKANVRRGKRLSMMPLQPTLPEECEEAVQLSLDSDDLKEKIDKNKIEAEKKCIALSVVVEKISSNQLNIESPSQKANTTKDSSLNKEQSPKKNSDSTSLIDANVVSTPTKDNTKLEYSKCSPMEVDESFSFFEGSPNKSGNKSNQILSSNKIHNKSKHESPAKDEIQGVDSVTEKIVSPVVSKSPKLQNEYRIDADRVNTSNNDSSPKKSKETEPSLMLNLEMSCDDDKVYNEDGQSDVIPSSQDETIDFTPPKIKPIIRSSDVTRNSSCEKSFHETAEVTISESQCRKSLNVSVKDSSPQLGSRKSINEELTPSSQKRKSLNESIEKSTPKIEDRKSICEIGKESTPQLRNRRSLNESAKECSPLLQNRVFPDESVKESTPMMQSRKSLNESIKESSPALRSRKSLDKPVEESSPLLQSRKSLNKSVKESSPAMQSGKSLSESVEKSTPLLRSRKSMNESTEESTQSSESVKESSPALRNRKSLNESLKDSTSQGRKSLGESVKESTPTQSKKLMSESVKESSPALQSSKLLRESEKESSPALRSRKSLSESVKVSTPSIQSRKSLSESVKESSPALRSRKSLSESEGESSPALRSRKSLSESVKVLTPSTQSRKSLSESVKESSPALGSRKSLSESEGESSPALQNRKSLSESREESTSTTEGRKSLNESVKASSPALRSRTSLSEFVSISTPPIQGKKSLNESAEEANSPIQGRKSLSETVKESTPLLRSRKSLNDSSLQLQNQISSNKSKEELSPKSQNRKSSVESDNDISMRSMKRQSLNKSENSILSKDVENISQCQVDNDEFDDSDNECVVDDELVDKKSVSNDEESGDDVDMDNELQESDDFIKLQLIDGSASEAESDYKSGDSMDSSEREDIELNEIVELGESLHSDSNENESDVSSYEKDSFVCSDDEEVDIASEDESSNKELSDLKQTVENKVAEQKDTKQSLENDASSERKVEGLWMVSPLKFSTEDNLSSNPRKRKLSGENKTSVGWTNAAGGFDIADDVSIERPTCPITASDFGSTTSFNIVTLKKSPKHILKVDPKIGSTSNFKENMLYSRNIKRKDSKSNKNTQQKIKAGVLSQNKY